MQCLKGYIGVKYCDGAASESGRYINELPGISIKGMDKIANEEQVNFLGVWKDIENRAIARFKTSSLSILKSTYSLKQILNSLNIGRNVTDDINGADKWRGILVRADFDISDLLAIYISSISLYSQSDVSEAEFKVFDSETGSVLWEQTKDLTEGWNTIKVDQYFTPYLEESSLFIAYRNVDSKSLTLSDEGCSCVVSEICSYCKLSVTGAESEVGNISVDTGNDTFGLSAVISLRCSYDSIVCNNLDIFGNAYMYALGMEFMYERIYSDRVNSYTSIDREKAKALFSDFTAEFEQNLKLALDGTQLDTDTCLVCDTIVQDKWLHP